MTISIRRVFCLILLFALGIFTLGADLDSARFEKLGHEMVCICGCNQILLECNHVGCPSSEGMRKELAAAIGIGIGPGSGQPADAPGGISRTEKGKTDKDVLDQFVEKYGPTVLAAPTTTGFGRVAWVMPFVVLFAGIGLVVVLVRNWRLRTAPLPQTTPGGLSPEYASELRARAREETEL